MYDDLVEFLQESVTPFHAAAIAESWLRAAGFTRLEEADYWNLEPGKGYYTTRNGSSVVAWRVPQHAIGGWRIVASHSDSPSWKIKADTVENDGCRRLSVEGYGGMIMSTWLDRPLTVGGRALVKTEDGIRTKAYDESKMTDPSLIIYHPVRQMGRGLIVTNGDQTDTILEFLKQGLPMEQALRTREFEPDGPNWTPRISGLLGPNGSYKLSFEYPGQPGTGHFLHTYAGDGDPLPSFTGEPEQVAVEGDIDSLASAVWDALDEANRISLFVRFTDLETRNFQQRIVNKYSGKETQA